MTTSEQINLPELDISQTEFLSLETGTIVRAANDYNQWVQHINQELDNARNSVYDLLLELRSYAQDMLPDAHDVASQEAVATDQGMYVAPADSVQGAPYELCQLLDFVDKALAATKQILG